jgi:DNA-directed RNA polymerase III subunit RPC1
VRKNKIIISPPDKAKEKLYFSMQTIKSIIPHIIVSGISTVSRAIINREDTSQGTTYNLFLEGTGLLSVLKIPGIEPYHTKTNHIIETEKVLGIEAARSVIISQIKYIMAEYSITVDPRHINLLADTMCCKGQVLGITRFGISRMKSSVLMQASFEKTIDHLFEAAGHSSYDKLEGVSERIILVFLLHRGYP